MSSPCRADLGEETGAPYVLPVTEPVTYAD